MGDRAGSWGEKSQSTVEEEQGRLCEGGGLGGVQQVEMGDRVAGASRLPCFKQ